MLTFKFDFTGTPSIWKTILEDGTEFNWFIFEQGKFVNGIIQHIQKGVNNIEEQLTKPLLYFEGFKNTDEIELDWIGNISDSNGKIKIRGDLSATPLSIIWFFNIDGRLMPENLDLIRMDDSELTNELSDQWEKLIFEEQARLAMIEGRAASTKGDYVSAIPFLDRAIQLYTQAESFKLLAKAIVEKADSYISLAKYEEAIDILDELDNIKSLSKEYIEYIASFSRSRIATALFQKQADIAFPDLSPEQFIENIKSDVEAMFKLNKLTDQEAFFKDLNLEKLQEIITIGDEARELYYAREFRASVPLFQKVIELRKQFKSDDLFEIAFTQNRLAEVYFSIGEYDKGIQVALEAISNWKACKEEKGSTLTYRLLGQLYLKTKSYQKAEYYLLAHLEKEKIFNPSSSWFSYLLCANLMRETQQLEKTIDYFEHAIREIEQQRNQISKDEHRIGFFISKTHAYLAYALLLLEDLKLYSKAFEVIERAKNRALVDLLREKINIKMMEYIGVAHLKTYLK